MRDKKNWYIVYIYHLENSQFQFIYFLLITVLGTCVNHAAHMGNEFLVKKNNPFIKTPNVK